MKGAARAKDARFEAPEAPMGWSVGRGCPLPTEGVWEGGCAPSPEIFLIFLVQCVQNIFMFKPKGGGIAQCPPKYATVYVNGFRLCVFLSRISKDAKKNIS